MSDERLSRSIRSGQETNYYYSDDPIGPIPAGQENYRDVL